MIYITGYYGRYIAVAYVPYNSTHLVNLIYLDNGIGYGQFTIPEELESGVYLLQAYTEWMSNFDHRLFYREELRILNRADKSELLSKSLSDIQKCLNKFFAEPVPWMRH